MKFRRYAPLLILPVIVAGLAILGARMQASPDQKRRNRRPNQPQRRLTEAELKANKEAAELTMTMGGLYLLMK